jgi:hypothetical protein
MGGIHLQQSDSFGEILLGKTDAALDETQFQLYD